MRNVLLLAAVALSMQACTLSPERRALLDQVPSANRYLLKREISPDGNAVVCTYSDHTTLRVLNILSGCPAG